MYNSSISQRFGYVRALFNELDADQQKYLIGVIDNAESFDDVPLDAQLWLEHAETRVGIAPSHYDQVQAQEAAIDEVAP